MKATAEPPLSVRIPGPRPDPIPVSRTARWALHAPWVLALAALLAAVLCLEGRDLALFLSGAGALAVLTGTVLAKLPRMCRALHHAGGLLALALLQSPEQAAAFVLPAGIVLVAALLARALALEVSPAVAPLAGRLPWRFRGTYRELALRFGLAGVGAGILLLVFAPTAPLRIVGVALLPLALRGYVGNLLPRSGLRVTWCAATIPHLAALALFVPDHGAIAAAWALVGAETMLFAGGALVVARRTGVTPLPRVKMALVLCAVLLLATITVPSSPEWLLLLGILLGIAAGPFVFPPSRKP